MVDSKDLKDMPLRCSSVDYLFLCVHTFVPALHRRGAGSGLGVKMDRPRPVWSKAPQARGITSNHAMSQTVLWEVTARTFVSKRGGIV